MGWVGVITNTGASILGQYAEPGSTLIVTRVQTGKGSVPASSMKAATALNDPVTTGILSGIRGITGGTMFSIEVGPHTSTYTLTEIGIFAKVGEGGTEGLLALIQHDGGGVDIPDSGDFPDFVMRLSAPMSISDSDDISYTVPPTALVSHEEFVAFEVDMATSLSGKKGVQSPVSDPSASGTSFTFIKSITQNAQGVISPQKATVPEMGAASSSAAGTAGLVPAPGAGKQGQFLRADKTWATPTNTTYSEFTGATSSADGTAGLVKKPLTANASQYLRGDGTWATPTNTDTKNTAGSTDTSSKIFIIGATSQAANPQTYSQDTAYVGTDGCLYSGGVKVLTAHQDISGKKNVQSAVSDPSASGTSLTFIKSISQNAQGVISPTKATVGTMGAASSSAAGTAGLVPAPAAGKQGQYLRGDGTWATPTNTTYSEFTGATSSADGTAGLVKKPLKANTAQYLRGDGTWATPTNTDTKNTAGSTDTSSKIFIIGATSQAANPQTYSQDTAYVGTDGCLYSGGAKVLTAHQDISGKKNVQSAVSDPSASGTSLTFIKSITQNAQGVISPAKATVSTMGAASSSAAGTAGLVPAPAKGDQAKFLRADGTWVVPTNTTYSDFTAATASAAGTHGLVPAPAAGKQASFLRGDKTWSVPTDTKNTAGSTDTSSKIFIIGATSQAANPQTYSQDTAYVGTDGCLYSGGAKVLTAHQDISGKKNVQSAVSDPSASGTSLTFIATLSQNSQGVISATKKSVPPMTGATSSADGASGLVPKPTTNSIKKFLRGDGTWSFPDPMVGATTSSDGSSGLVPAPLKGNYGMYLRADGTWATPTNTTYSVFQPATSSAAGTAGLVPAPGAGKQASFLSGGGTWSVPTDTKNTAGSTNNATDKIFLIGATSQTASSVTQSNSNVYMQSGALYSKGSEVVTIGTAQSISAQKTFQSTQLFSNTTNATSPTQGGCARFSGGIGVARDVHVGGGVAVGVDLYVAGLIHGTLANDYAEYRKAETTEPGRVVRESASGAMVKTEKRMMRGCKIVSDTYGIAIGERDNAKTPIGVTGRVLAYPARDRWKFRLGAPVCSGPNGTVDVMSRLEAIIHPECIIGTVSEIPKYEKWICGTNENPKEIEVDGRIWIYVR